MDSPLGSPNLGTLSNRLQRLRIERSHSSPQGLGLVSKRRIVGRRRNSGRRDSKSRIHRFPSNGSLSLSLPNFKGGENKENEEVLRARPLEPVLPTLAKDQGVPRISPSVLIQLLKGEYKRMVPRWVVIDARFPFEFNGGHIQGAVNIAKLDDVRSHLSKILGLKLSKDSCETPKERIAIVIHCEFSSHRGPRLAQMLRNWDRSLNFGRPDYLYFPDLYLLEGGYQAFYNTECTPRLCEPDQYIKMKDPRFNAQLKLDMAALRRETNGRSRSWSQGTPEVGIRTRTRSLTFVSSFHDKLNSHHQPVKSVQSARLERGSSLFF